MECQLKVLAEIIVAKHRNGSLDTVRLKFVKELTRFTNIDAFDPGDVASFGPNGDFDSEGNGTGTITVGSKMNNDDFSSNITDDEVPF